MDEGGEAKIIVDIDAPLETVDELAAGLAGLSLSGPFVTQADFWLHEGGGDNPGDCAPLLNRNSGALSTDSAANADLLMRTAGWAALCGADKIEKVPKVTALKGAGTTESIIWRDAERTFKTESFRKQMITTLESVADGDYHQGMGYFCGFLLLLVDPSDVTKILHCVGCDGKYTPGYWKGQPEAFVRDAMTYERLLEKHNPAVAEHLKKAGLVPEAYSQKWFVGLCVHTMPFAPLIDLFEAFLQEGHMFLFKLSLCIVDSISDKILESRPTEVNKIFELLRLDKKFFPDEMEKESHFFSKIVIAAKALDLDAAEVTAVREQEMKVLQEKLVKVRASEQALKDADDSDEIVFSDEDSDEEDEAERLAKLAAQ